MFKKILKWLGVLLALIILLLGSGYYSYLRIGYPEAPENSGVIKKQTFTVDGVQRTLQYYQPGQLSAHPSLIFVLHGSMGNGARIRKLLGYELEQIADREGFIIVYPDGFEGHWNDCRGTAAYSANQKNINDDGFFATMIEYFVDRYRVSPEHVFATGFSNGGQMAYKLAYQMPRAFRAVAAIAASLPAAISNDCSASGEPVSVALFNGTRDPVNPYEGGLVTVFGDSTRGTVLSTLKTAEYWATLAGLPESPKVEILDDVDGNAETRVVLRRWEGAQPQKVWLYTLEGSGHVVPSPDIQYGSFFGGAAGDIHAGSEVWTFFKAVSG